MIAPDAADRKGVHGRTGRTACRIGSRRPSDSLLDPSRERAQKRGVTATVRVVEAGSIERSQGKAKRVIDRRPKS
jgi:hypothetical protein